MGGTTPTYGFPYPVGTDRVADGDNAIQALAVAVENRIVSNAAVSYAETTAFSFASGVANAGEGCYAWRQDRLVVMRVVLAIGATFAANNTLAQCSAAGFTPVLNTRFTLTKQASQFTGSALVATDGSISAGFSTASGEVLMGTAVFMTPALLRADTRERERIQMSETTPERRTEETETVETERVETEAPAEEESDLEDDQDDDGKPDA